MKRFIPFFIFLILMSAIAFSDTGEPVKVTTQSKEETTIYGQGASNLKIQEVRQDPFPANPGEYLDLYLKIDNVGGSVSKPQFEFILSYPFSLDPTNSKEFAGIDPGEKVTLHYKIRVDKNALPGDYEIEFRAHISEKIYYPYYFTVRVDDVTSAFDVALHEVTKEGVSLAISNIGKNVANSITVRLDNQQDFDLLGPSSTIIGNLNAGDYTLLNLFVAPKPVFEINSQPKLNLEIDYTDTTGNRRTVQKEIPVFLTPKIERGFEELKNAAIGEEEQEGKGSAWILFAVFFILVVVAASVFFYYQKKKRKNEV